jgi:hypothetical protein
MSSQYIDPPSSTAGTRYDLLGSGKIHVYRYMMRSDISTYGPLYNVDVEQFKLLTNNKVTNEPLALMVHYHVQDQKGDEDFGNVFNLGYEFPPQLQSVTRSPFISVTVHPGLAITGRSLDSLIVNNDSIVELEVPLAYIMPTTDPISKREGELLVLLPPNVTFQSLIVNIIPNKIYHGDDQPNKTRLNLNDTYGITGGEVEYNGQYFRWTWTRRPQTGRGSSNSWITFLKSQKGSHRSIKDLSQLYKKHRGY